MNDVANKNIYKYISNIMKIWKVVNLLPTIKGEIIPADNLAVL